MKTASEPKYVASQDERRSRDWPDAARLIGNEAVEIRLESKEYIPTTKSGGEQHSDLKHAIRLQFSDQLSRKWRDSPLLNSHQKAQASPGEVVIGFAEGYRWPAGDPQRGIPGAYHRPEDAALPFFRVEMCGYGWVPLITWHNHLTCRLDITFTGDGGSTIRRDGDIDNRVKTIFDALRMPLRDREVPGNRFGKGELAYCLLEDDSLIHEYSVRAVRSPYSPAEYLTQVNVTVLTMDGYEPHPALERFR